MSVTPSSSPASIESWDVLDLLTALVQKSLVVYEEDEQGQGRYRLLETVRQYARDRQLEAGETEAVRGRHLDWFLALAERHALPGESQRAWRDRWEREHDNLRAALAWSETQGHAEAGLRLGGALAWFWSVRGYWSEGREHLAELLALPGGAPPRSGGPARTVGRARALSGAGSLAMNQGEYEAARALLEESLAIRRELGDEHEYGHSLILLGFVTRSQGELGTARALFEEFLALSQKQGNTGLIPLGLVYLGDVERDEGNYDAARRLWEESLTIFRELDSKYSIVCSVCRLGRAFRDQGESAAARALLEEGLAIFRELGDKQGIPVALSHLGRVAFDQGNHMEARALHAESLAMCRERGDKRSFAANLEGLAAVAHAQGQSERAARLLGAAEALRVAAGMPLPPADRAEYDRFVEAVRTPLGEEAFAAAWPEGQSLSLEEAIKDALEG